MCIYIYIYIYMYIYISDCVQTVYELPLLPNNTGSEPFLHKSGAARSFDWMFYHWGVVLAVTGRNFMLEKTNLM